MMARLDLIRNALRREWRRLKAEVANFSSAPFSSLCVKYKVGRCHIFKLTLSEKPYIPSISFIYARVLLIRITQEMIFVGAAPLTPCKEGHVVERELRVAPLVHRHTRAHGVDAGHAEGCVP